MALDAAITNLATYQAAAFGFTTHAVAPESVTAPAVVNYPESGSFSFAAQSLGRGEHVVRSDLLLSRHDGGGLATADAKLRPYVTAYRDMLAAHMTLGGQANGISGLSYEYGVVEYGGVAYLGIRFRQTVYIKDAITVAE